MRLKMLVIKTEKTNDEELDDKDQLKKIYLANIENDYLPEIDIKVKFEEEDDEEKVDELVCLGENDKEINCYVVCTGRKQSSKIRYYFTIKLFIKDSVIEIENF